MSKNLHFGYDDPTPKQEAVSPGRDSRDSIESEDERGKTNYFSLYRIFQKIYYHLFGNDLQSN